MKTSSFNIEIATEVIRSNIYKEVLRNKLERSIKRNRIYGEIFQEISPEVHPASYFQWLPMPRGCGGRAFEALDAEKGVRVYGSERFAVGNTENRSFVRIVTSSPASVEELCNGLQILKRCYLDLIVDEAGYIV